MPKFGPPIRTALPERFLAAWIKVMNAYPYDVLRLGSAAPARRRSNSVSRVIHHPEGRSPQSDFPEHRMLPASGLPTIRQHR